jgi:putative restriction endonuclease
MTLRKPWSREETILAMNLYCRIPFGRQHSRAPEVIELADAIDRTPSSVAMKLNNLTSIDPEEKTRGVKGLSGSSRLDKQIWGEFHDHWEKMAEESEALWCLVVTKRKPLVTGYTSPHNLEEEELDVALDAGLSRMPTEIVCTTKVRLVQAFFRQMVLSSYLGRCCISGVPIPTLLIASHILPWSDYPEHRINPRNGLCLSRLHDAAFDKGLICFDEDYRLVLSKRLRDYLPNKSLNVNFIDYDGEYLCFPEKFLPGKEFLEYHRHNIYSD